MKISVFATILSIFLLPSVCRAQKNGIPQGSTRQSIVVDFGQNGDLVYPFTFVKGSSIYSLSKAFDVNPDDMYLYNHLKPGASIPEGRILKIPLVRNKIKTQYPQQKRFVVLTYIVKPGETLYHLAKRKMNMDVELLKKMNGLTDNQLRQGGEIILGWYILGDEKEYTSPLVKTHSANPVKVKNDVLEDTDPTKEVSEKAVQRRVIGFWDKSKSSMRGLFVLSNEAKPGTKMEIYFPMKNTTIEATVLGRIPPETYQDEIEVILSPEAARRLGIIDSRFSVETSYIAPM